MNLQIRPLLISLFILSSSFSLHADAQGDAAAEQRRLDSQRQDQQIQDNKLDEQRQDNKRQEQQIQDRKMEDRRAEQRRLDNQRRLSFGGQVDGRSSEIADRGRGGIDRDRDRYNNLSDSQDLMDDTIDERILERNQALGQYQNQNQMNGAQGQSQGHSQGQPQYGCTGPGCQASNGAKAGCTGFNCQDPQALHNMEASQKCDKEHHEQYKQTVEQWDRDHPRD